MHALARKCVSMCLVAWLVGCGASNSSNGIVGARPGPGWSTILSDQQLTVVRQTFPLFQPELFAPGTDPKSTDSLSPGNFSPALFLGPQSREGMKTTPAGVLLETNGYDASPSSVLLPASGTYFDRRGNAFTFELRTTTIVPLSYLPSQVTSTAALPWPRLDDDHRKPLVAPEEVDEILLTVHDSVALAVPEVANIPLNACQVKIEPSIFFVSGSNFGNTWSGGMTEEIGNGTSKVHVVIFYINAEGRVADWREFLAFEAINCYVLAAGRRDLAQ